MPQRKVALFLDAENVSAKNIEKVFNDLSQFGVITIRRAYGNWASDGLKAWKSVLQQHAIMPVQHFSLTVGKNAADMALVVDAMDVLFTKPVDIFCLVSSDCDFTPLVTRLLADGKTVIGFGERKSPKAFQNSCSAFVVLNPLPDEKLPVNALATLLDIAGVQTSPKPSESSNVQSPTPVKAALPPAEKPSVLSQQTLSQQTLSQKAHSQKAQSINQDSNVIALLSEGIKVNCNDYGWANIGQVGQHFKANGKTGIAKHGFKKLSDMLDAIEVFDIKVVGGHVRMVRDNRLAKKPKEKKTKQTKKAKKAKK